MPEVFGLGLILRNFGILGAIIWLLVSVFTAAILGVWLAKRKEKTNKWWPYWVFTLFLFAGWFVNFGVSLAYDKASHIWLLLALCAAIFAFLLSLFLIWFGDSSLISKDRAEGDMKWVLFVLFGFFWAAFSLTSFWEGGLLSFTKTERVAWWHNFAVADYKTGEDPIRFPRVISQPESALWAIPRYGVQLFPHSQYYYAAGNLRLGRKSEANRYFGGYAGTLPEDQRAKWLALGNFFGDDFWAAERYFKESREPFPVLLSRFRNSQLTAEELTDYKSHHVISSADIGLMAKIGEVFSLENQLQEKKNRKNETAAKKDLTATPKELKDELRAIKRGFWLLYKGDTKTKEEWEEFGKLAEVPAPTLYASEEKKVDGLKSGINAEIENRVIVFALKEQPPLPISAEWLNKESVISRVVSFVFFPLSLGFLLIFSRPLRNDQNRVWRFFGGIFTFSAFRKFYYFMGSCVNFHSLVGRGLAAEIALLEPEGEKGLFTAEIAAVYDSLFPLDVFQGWYFLARAKRIIALRRIRERETIYLSGVLLEIKQRCDQIAALNSQPNIRLAVLWTRATDAVGDFSNDRRGFLPAKEELLGVYRDLESLSFTSAPISAYSIPAHNTV